MLASLPALSARGFAFEQPELRVKAGQLVALRLQNGDQAPHSFDVDALGVHAAIPVGQDGVALFRPTAPGTYIFDCAPHFDKESRPGDARHPDRGVRRTSIHHYRAGPGQRASLLWGPAHPIPLRGGGAGPDGRPAGSGRPGLQAGRAAQPGLVADRRRRAVAGQDARLRGQRRQALEGRAQQPGVAPGRS